MPEGRSAPCGALIAVIAAEDVGDDEIDAFPGDVDVPAAEEGAASALFEQGRAPLDALAAVLGAAIDQLAPERVHRVGHSLDGRLALRLAAGIGERTASLALIAPDRPGPEVNADFVEQFITAGRRKPMKAALQMLVADKDAIGPDMVERTLSYKRIDGVPGALRAIVDASLLNGRATEGASADLAAITAPVLVLRGAADEELPPVPTARSVETRVLPGIGHMPQMEASGEVTAALAGHIETSE